MKTTLNIVIWQIVSLIVTSLSALIVIHDANKSFQIGTINFLFSSAALFLCIKTYNSCCKNEEEELIKDNV